MNKQDPKHLIHKYNVAITLRKFNFNVTLFLVCSSHSDSPINVLKFAVSRY